MKKFYIIALFAGSFLYANVLAEHSVGPGLRDRTEWWDTQKDKHKPTIQHAKSKHSKKNLVAEARRHAAQEGRQAARDAASIKAGREARRKKAEEEALFKRAKEEREARRAARAAAPRPWEAMTAQAKTAHKSHRVALSRADRERASFGPTRSRNAVSRRSGG